MATLTVNINDKKTEKAIFARRSLNKSEQVIYNRLKKSIEEINLYNEGKIGLQDAKEFLNEL